jgi:hypothetical protein
MIAGPKALERYAGYQGQKNEDDHPVGIIYQVLGNRALRQDGTRKNYPNKVSRFSMEWRPSLHDWVN